MTLIVEASTYCFEMFWLAVLGHYKEGPQYSLLGKSLVCLPSVYLTLHDITACDKISQAFRPCILEAIKHGGSEGLGTGLHCTVCRSVKGYGVGSSVDAHEPATRSPAVWSLFEGPRAMLLHLLEVLEDTLVEGGKGEVGKKWKGVWIYVTSCMQALQQQTVFKQLRIEKNWIVCRKLVH